MRSHARVEGSNRFRGVAQPGRALRSGRRSRRFKSCHPDHLNQLVICVHRPREDALGPHQVHRKCTECHFAGPSPTFLASSSRSPPRPRTHCPGRADANAPMAASAECTRRHEREDPVESSEFPRTPQAWRRDQTSSRRDDRRRSVSFWHIGARLAIFRIHCLTRMVIARRTHDTALSSRIRVTALAGVPEVSRSTG